jgi:hypothetical protein
MTYRRDKKNGLFLCVERVLNIPQRDVAHRSSWDAGHPVEQVADPWLQSGEMEFTPNTLSKGQGLKDCIYNQDI